MKKLKTTVVMTAGTHDLTPLTRTALALIGPDPAIAKIPLHHSALIQQGNMPAHVPCAQNVCFLLRGEFHLHSIKSSRQRAPDQHQTKFVPKQLARCKIHEADMLVWFAFD
ncbi:hypothetical protein JQ634_25310 [Bradyrhizobium sp. AUGA SZCCT0240]|jgi:hypothetical protein|uniref:hypothetical protein n=1 Tax=unclassified Bradyrhizobium TaxID=2631580 RepID=UPI001BA4CBC0|nr:MULTISPECIES: hypothetical protein [unclassified Bradyrhizobium]MBR1195446.1 hypothetical protein [Bradyrhizobium sp. AUGA SZCCT0158]MBR1244702.1 hypothetical protein [Bradyrhizobium sp. AUGA SZCCT0274]MBR1249077.1 hypothetical protein [Bradyrhizobium sp. AUGA SZCCT0169]MBR1257016.1 hypothetical protein [Bradyrhizobium sp. AUGA SZCCT0240]